MSDKQIKHKEERINLINKMNNGQYAKIIAYRSYTSIDVEFEDGTIY